MITDYNTENSTVTEIWINEMNIDDITLKYCRHNEGNFRRSTVINGIITFKPYMQTSEANIVKSLFNWSSAVQTENKKKKTVYYNI